MENGGFSTGVTLGSEALSDRVWTRHCNVLVNVPLSLRLNPKWCITIFCDHTLPDLKARPFKSQVSAGAGALLNFKWPVRHSVFPFGWQGCTINGTPYFSLYIKFNNLSWNMKFEYLPGYCAAAKLAAPPSIILDAQACNVVRVWIPHRPDRYVTTHWPWGISCSAYAWSVFLTVSFGVQDKMCVHSAFVFLNTVYPLFCVRVTST